jgi:hypothetical protein
MPDDHPVQQGFVVDGPAVLRPVCDGGGFEGEAPNTSGVVTDTYSSLLTDFTLVKDGKGGK